MAESVLYTVILVVYFTGLMGLGLWFNRRNRSRQEYFLARGDLGPATLGFSYSATQMSGSSYMGAVGTERELGYNFAPAGVSSAAAAWFTYVLLGERLRRLASRIRCTTIVDVFEARYRGKGVSLTATLLMLGGAVTCVVWYGLGYMEHGSFDNWIAGLWPALVGPAVSLVLLVGVSLVTRPPPREVVEVFFGGGGGGGGGMRPAWDSTILTLSSEGNGLDSVFIGARRVGLTQFTAEKEHIWA